MTDAPPPAYDENATVVEDDDGKATDTTPQQETAQTAEPTPTETQPKPESSPSEPPEEEGPFGSPLQRVMFFSVVILLYAILAFWMPVYWMASQANPCRFVCNTWPAPGGSYFSPYLGGCYGATITDCDDLCDDDCDIIYDIDAEKETFYETFAANYGATSRGARLSGWTFITLGIAFMAVGCIVAYFGQKKEKPLFQKIGMGFLGVGGFLEVIGAFIFTTSFDTDGISDSYEDFYGAVRSAVWLEYVFPGVIAVIFAVDIFKLILNTEEMRIYLLTVPVVIVGFFGGIVMAYIINWEPDGVIGYDFEAYDALGCCSAGYFIMGIIAVVRILIVKDIIKLDDPAQAITIKFVLAVLMIIGGFICAVGYWAFIEVLFDCSTSLTTNAYGYSIDCTPVYYLTYMYGDIAGPFTVENEIDNVHYEGQCKAYYCGYSFFILGIAIIIAYDMDIVENYKKVRAAQEAANATQSGGDGNATAAT